VTRDVTSNQVMPQVMGIVNVTPDSFSDGGAHGSLDAAVVHGRRLATEGASIIDVGGESTRPGATPVPVAEELRRTIPVVEALAEDGHRVSIDTTKPEVARRAVAAGASVVNDVSATLGELAGELGVGWIAMHRRGDPRTMQDDPRYDDVVDEVLAFLVARAEAGRAAGVRDLWIDPGIGFGKTAEHNLALLAALDRFVATGWPVAVGTSRKGFLGRLLAASDGTDDVDVDDRLEGSLVTATWAFAQGVALVRAHDVRSTVHAARVVAA
jgi:dihydropteroate synthase